MIMLRPSTPDDPARHLLYLTTPALWPYWPFLPVVRRRCNREDLGVVFDARTAAGLTGFSATVFLENLFHLPATLTGLLALPREVYDSAEELFDRGWRID